MSSVTGYSPSDMERYAQQFPQCRREETPREFLRCVDIAKLKELIEATQRENIIREERVLREVKECKEKIVAATAVTGTIVGGVGGAVIGYLCPCAAPIYVKIVVGSAGGAVGGAGIGYGVGKFLTRKEE